MTEKQKDRGSNHSLEACARQAGSLSRLRAVRLSTVILSEVEGSRSARCALSELSAFLINLQQQSRPQKDAAARSFTPAASVQDDGIFESKCINSSDRLEACPT